MTDDDLDAVRAALLSLTPAQQAAVEALATGATHAKQPTSLGCAVRPSRAGSGIIRVSVLL